MASLNEDQMDDDALLQIALMMSMQAIFRVYMFCLFACSALFEVYKVSVFHVSPLKSPRAKRPSPWNQRSAPRSQSPRSLTDHSGAVARKGGPEEKEEELVCEHDGAGHGADKNR